MVSTEQNTHEISGKSAASSGEGIPTYDLVCIGFGPAQIATAIANREARKPSKVLFLEQKPNFSWHPSSHLPRTRMDNAFIYDLATTRNPRSAFTYVNYLLTQDRLVEFANSDRLNPLREEFEHYLRWCADQFKDEVRYGSEVVGVVAEKSNNSVQGWSVAIKEKNGRTYVVRAKNIAAPSPSQKSGFKARPLLNVNFEAGQSIMSMEDYVSRRDDLREFRDSRLNIALVGSGKQTVEILDDLLSCHRLGNITVITDNEALAPLRALAEEPAPIEPRLCSIWAKPTCEDAKTAVLSSSEIIRRIYDRAYEKQLKGEVAMKVVIGEETSQHTTEANVIIAEKPLAQLPSNGLFHGVDALVLGCQQKGTCLEEVKFKRGTVAENCSMWLLTANTESGRSLATDIAVRAGEVVAAVGKGAESSPAQAGMTMINARI